MRTCYTTAVIALLIAVSAGPAAGVIVQDTHKALDQSDVPLDQVEITLERSACFGECPVYSVTIRGTGEVEYEGKRFVSTIGRETGRISEQELVDLLNRFLDANFFDALPRYETKHELFLRSDGMLEWREWRCTDLPSTTIGLRLGTNSQSVYLYYYYPDQLKQLADAIDAAAGTDQWVHGTE